jgi:hypothetical protein
MILYYCIEILVCKHYDWENLKLVFNGSYGKHKYFLNRHKKKLQCFVNLNQKHGPQQ